MDIINQLFGEGKELTVLQMCDRAVVIYFVTHALIRISGRRTFGRKSAFDNTVAIILGAVLSRAIVGASPFLPTVACSLAIVVLHRVLAWVSIKNKFIRTQLQGSSMVLYQNGEFNRENMTRSLIGEKDLLADVRLKANVNSLADIDQIYMETTGEVSVVKKKYSV